MLFLEVFWSTVIFLILFFESDLSKYHDIDIITAPLYHYSAFCKGIQEYFYSFLSVLVDKTDLFRVWFKTICYSVIVYFCILFLLACCAFVNFACRWQHSVLTTELISTTGHQYFCMAHIKGHINTVLALFCWESTVSSDITPDRWDWFWSPSALHWLAALCRDIQSMCVFVTWTLVASHRSDASYCISITEYVWVEK